MSRKQEYINGGINKNTYNLFFEYVDFPVPTKNTKTNDKILDKIDGFTMLNSTHIKILKKIKEKMFFNKIYAEGTICRFITV